jgi:acyl-CoA thioester hydrolase
MKLPPIPLEKVLTLDPPCLHLTVPDSYEDRNGHMNMRWYSGIFDEAGDVLHERLGLTPEFHAPRGSGTFDLEHHIHFLREVLIGDRTAVYARIVAASAQRVHYLLFMVNETRACVAAVFECLNAFADLRARRTAPFPPEIAAKIRPLIAAEAARDWPPPLSGAIQV